MLFLAEAIPKDLPITIVTNSLGIISALSGRPVCKVITMGGVVDYENRIFLGPWTETQLERFHFEFAFLGADSVSAEGFGCKRLRLLRDVAQGHFPFPGSLRVGRFLQVRQTRSEPVCAGRGNHRMDHRRPGSPQFAGGPGEKKQTRDYRPRRERPVNLREISSLFPRRMPFSVTHFANLPNTGDFFKQRP